MPKSKKCKAEIDFWILDENTDIMQWISLKDIPVEIHKPVKVKKQ